MSFFESTDFLCHFGILGMKWGVRRYENKDGTLTAAGKRRYEHEKALNDGKKKDNRLPDEGEGSRIGVGDVNRWVKNDYTHAKSIADSSKQLTNSLADLERATDRSSKKERPRADLSSMTDKELRERINREFLERQYNDLFNPKKVSKGREHVKETLGIVGSVLGVTSSALGIALAVKSLKE